MSRLKRKIGVLSEKNTAAAANLPGKTHTDDFKYNEVKEMKKYDVIHFPERLKEARTQAGLSRRKLRDFCGGDVYRFEQGIVTPNIERTCRYAQALGVSPVWLAYGVGDMKDEENRE